jgi:hypothetical protein
MRKPSYTAPIVIGALALGSLVMMNVVSQKNAPKSEAQQEAEAQEASEKKAAAEPTLDASHPLRPMSSLDLVMTDGFKETGPKDAETTVVVGYEWTPGIQADPEKVQEIVKMLERNAPKAKVVLTNVDENPGVPVGIQVNGKVVAPIGEDGTVSPKEIPAVMQAVTAK